MKTKQLLRVVALAAVAAFASGCSFETIGPTEKGKILTTAGYSAEVLEPGKITLLGRDTLVRLQTNTNMYSEKVSVILKDKLTLGVTVQFRGRIAGSQVIINSMFSDITPGEDNLVEFREVYGVYGRMTVQNKTREVIGDYTVEDVQANFKRISIQIAEELKLALANTPLEISEITLGKMAYPKVVTDAIEDAKAREMAINKEKAEAEIDLVKKNNERVLAEADYQIKMVQAKAIRDSNKVIGQGVTPALLKLRALEVQEKMAENKSAVFMPYEAMGSVGAQTRIYGK